jgi:hypothetical protein
MYLKNRPEKLGRFFCAFTVGFSCLWVDIPLMDIQISLMA